MIARGPTRRLRVRGGRLVGAMCVIAVVAAFVPSSVAVAGEDLSPVSVVVVWNQALMASVRPLSGFLAARTGAIVQASVFDAVNGITGRYQPYQDPDTAPAGAASAAAAAGAAYEALRALIPDQDAVFNTLLDQTVPGRAHGAAARGVAWGESVADNILARRAHDGFADAPPPYAASADPGRWQPTPPLFVGPVGRQLVTATPFAIESPSQFRPPPPPALTSARYAADFAEVEAYGSIDSTVRTAYGTETAKLWAADGPLSLWDRVADTLIVTRQLGLTDAVRLLAQMNIAMADAVVAIWDAKNYYDTWRPITAIENADADGNPATDPDPGWLPLLPTPPFQEYPSGHAGISQAAAAVLATRFGDATPISISTPNMPGVVHTFSSFTAAVAEVTDARIYAGFHFRFSCDAADLMGRRIADLVTSMTMQPRHGHES